MRSRWDGPLGWSLVGVVFLALFLAPIIAAQYEGKARQRAQSVVETTDYNSDKPDLKTEATVGIVVSLVFEVALLTTWLVLGTRPDTPARVAVSWGTLAALVMGLVGALVSQFSPVYGLIAYLYQPFTVGRLTLLAGHTLLFGCIGFLVGGAIGALSVRHA
jgi:hypothetical protein